MKFPSTLVCVHAHPDDEAIFTAGISAHYAALGYDTVLVTYTNGRLGFDPSGRPGSDPNHDDRETVSRRAGELQLAAAIAGFSRVVSFGYDDSGMAGWPQNGERGVFANADVDAVARVLAALFDEVGATVVVTYDENGFYGHPDHIKANQVTRRAIELSSVVQRLYYPVVPDSVLASFTSGASEQGVFLPAWVLDAVPGTPDERVATTMDVSQYAECKQKAIAAHASQIDNADLVTMSPDLFTLFFGTEYYELAWSRDGAHGFATDLFGGL
jgi:LmbE family N-acetylglucosaminyl deacetylase